MSATTWNSGRRPTVPDWTTRFSAVAREWWQSFTMWRGRMRAASTLRRLDDHALRDIGLTRTEVLASVVHGRRGGIGD